MSISIYGYNSFRHFTGFGASRKAFCHECNQPAGTTFLCLLDDSPLWHYRLSMGTSCRPNHYCHPLLKLLKPFFETSKKRKTRIKYSHTKRPPQGGLCLSFTRQNNIFFFQCAGHYFQFSLWCHSYGILNSHSEFVA